MEKYLINQKIHYQLSMEESNNIYHVGSIFQRDFIDEHYVDRNKNRNIRKKEEARNARI